jgi:Mechanosensitive ion channel
MTTTDEPQVSSQPELAPKPRSLRRRVLSRVSIQSKLLMMLLVTSILSAAVVGAIGYQSGRGSLRASVFDALTEIRQSQTRQLQAEVADLQNSLVVFTRGSTATGLLIMPNSVLAAASFTNFSRPPGAHSLSVTTTFAVDDPPDDVITMLNRVAAVLPQLRPDATPSSGHAGGLQYSTGIPLRTPADDFAAKSMFLRWVWYASRRAGCTSTKPRTSSPLQSGWRLPCASSRPRCGSTGPTRTSCSPTSGSPGTAPTSIYSSPARCPNG